MADVDFLDLIGVKNPPPSCSREYRLVWATVNNRLDVLKELLDSPDWYNVSGVYGYNLLQIAIYLEVREVFDYLLDLPGFPLEYKNERTGETVLDFAVSQCYFLGLDEPIEEYFSRKLVEKGVDVHVMQLYAAIACCYLETVQLMVERGVDDGDETYHLHAALELSVEAEFWDCLWMLLALGAEPTMDIFEAAVWQECPIELQEVLLWHFFDRFSDDEIKFELILKLAQLEAPFFHELLKLPFKVSVGSPTCELRFLLSIKLAYLEEILERFQSDLLEIFSNVESLPLHCHYQLNNSPSSINYYYHKCNAVFKIENLELLLRGDFKSYVINTFASTKFYALSDFDRSDERKVTELYCFFLSYGLNISDSDLEFVYQKFGYCELFKIMLHMEVYISGKPEYRTSLMPRFIYDVNMTLEKILKDPGYCSGVSLDDFLRYFAHPKLVELNEGRGGRMNLPKMPRLIELARNKFRQYLIEKFKIRTLKKFLALLDNLPICKPHKKIICYETPLYD